MRKIIFGAVFLLFMGIGVARISAGIGFGGGTYVNLCGSGTAANLYSCSPKCSLSTGVCSGQNNGVVKYVCNGRWDQCLEAESYWSNYAEIGKNSCGKTVQISVFDKKCRIEDGGWDPTCNLEGYMVWYSGDCQRGVAGTEIPTIKPTNISVTSTKGVVPTITVTKPGVCNQSCALDSECQAGFRCSAGSCRNPACTGDVSCFCGGKATPTPMEISSVITKTPDTGGEELIIGVGVVGLIGIAGFLATAANRIWE